MNTVVMSRVQRCRTPVRPRLPTWRPIVPRLQRVLVGVLTVALMLLVVAWALAGHGGVLAPAATVRAIELPPVVVHGHRLAPADCPVPTDTQTPNCPLPTGAQRQE